MTRRLTSSSLAGTPRTLVAVGTSRLASMLATMRAAAPRRGTPSSSAVEAGFALAGAAAGAGAVGAGAGAEPLAVGAGALAGAWPLAAGPRPLVVGGGCRGRGAAGAGAGAGVAWSVSRL